MVPVPHLRDSSGRAYRPRRERHEQLINFFIGLANYTHPPMVYDSVWVADSKTLVFFGEEECWRTCTRQILHYLFVCIVSN